MQKRLIYAAALSLVLEIAVAQPAATPGNQSLSLDQQSKISEIITNLTPQLLTGINFSVAPDVAVPPEVALQRLPVEAEKLAPQLQGGPLDRIALGNTVPLKLVGEFHDQIGVLADQVHQRHQADVGIDVQRRAARLRPG